MALSPDGRWGLTSDAGGQVILWDVTTGKKEHSFQSQATVATVVFSPDGRLALSTSGDGTARLWDLAARKELHVIRVPPTLVTGALFSPDGRRFLLTCQDQTGRLYEVATREEIYRFTTAGFFNFQAIMADGRRLVLSNSGGLSVRQLPGPDHPEGQLLLQGDNVYAPVLVKGEGQPVRTVNNTPGGTVLDLRQGDYTLEPTAQRSWPASRLSAQRVSVKAGRQVVVRVLRAITPLVTPTPERLAAGEKELKPLLAREGEPGVDRERLRADLLELARKYRGLPPALAAAGALRRLPSPLDRLDGDKVPAALRAEIGKGDPRQAPPGLAAVLRHRTTVRAFALRPDGAVLASGDGDGLLKLWDLATGKELRSWRANAGGVLRGGVQPGWQTAGQRR